MKTAKPWIEWIFIDGKCAKNPAYDPTVPLAIDALIREIEDEILSGDTEHNILIRDAHNLARELQELNSKLKILKQTKSILAGIDVNEASDQEQLEVFHAAGSKMKPGEPILSLHRSGID